MSGKPYSIQEFKMIVDYLVENKLYGETKARKMWVDFANTKLTTRTWQSLKETFLKRVLPDIHNPYFHLTNEQISSFRARCDLADRNKNKLDIITISENSSSNGAKDNEPSHNEGETTAGENITCSKVPVRSRSSADTVILENCYETAEEIQKDLESNESDEKPSRESKSLRDCITYSEPLTPMLQEVLDDFASEPEDSDREGQMEIDENVPEDNQEVPGPNNEVLISKSENTDVAKNAKGLSSEVVSEVVEEVLAQELDGGSKSENISPKENIPNVMSDIEELPVANMDDEISSMQVENGTEKDDDAEASRHAEAPEVTNILTAEVTEKLVAQNPETLDETVIHDSHSEPQVQSGGLNNSNSTVDASLPNNPEALTNKNSKTVNNKEASESVIEVTNNSNKTPKSPKKAPRKRSISEDNSSTIDNKKKKIDINLKPPAKTDNKVTESHSDKNAEDKLKANEEPLQPDVINKPLLDNPIDLEKPSTSFETHVVDVIETEKRSNTKELPEIKNPCLQNISLFDEQFNKTNYTLSESSDTEQNKKESQADKQGTSVSKPSNEVVLVRSNSESDTEEVHAVPKKKQRAGVLISKAEREKAIANMFGFTSGGGVGAKRKRQLSRRSRTVSHNNTSYNNTSHHTAAPAPVSNTSDWTSESEDFVSPPRSRKNRPTRKYMKPHAVKVSALEEEGGLFIMYGKKIYPIIKDGKIVKNYITYLPESDSDEGETFWKQKYEEEKKKASEFKKLLEEAKEPQQLKDTYSPVRQANPHRNSRRSSIAVEPSNSVAKETSLPVPDEKKEELKEFPPETIKIKFTKNNEEVQLEGHWPQIHPVLEQVVNIFHKEVKKAVVPESNTTVMHPAQSQSKLSSGSSTPVIIPDPEIHAKVNEIEKEIFKQIEELDKEEDIKPNGQATNVTKRKMGPPPPRTSSSSAHSPEEPPKISNGPETKESEGNSRTRNKKSKETENNNNTQEYVSKRPTRMPRKILNETVNINQSKTMKTRQSTQKLNTSVNDEDGEVRYMLPPRNSRHSLKSPANKKTNQKKSSEKPSKIFSSPDSVSLNSMDSTQGYQDTDVSPVNTEIKRKKKIDASSFVTKTRNSIRRSTRRKTHPYLYHDAYNDSSNSSVDASVRVVSRESSSLNTDAYISESYQLLNPRAKVSSRQLEPIDETAPIVNEMYIVRHLESICRNEISAQQQSDHNFTSPSCQITSDVGSSSNVSLPMSPELSLVENMSISKEMLNSVEDYPTINEMQSNEIKEGTITMRSKYNMISDVDVSVPLMNQECEFESCNTVTEMSTEPKSLVTESMLRNIGTFNINDHVTATDTLNKKLHDLLLESAKKTTEISALKEASMMDVDATSVEVQKKPKANKKRCSTPQKRKGSKKSVTPTVDPVVEEEHVESCSYSGRKSCPPVVQRNLSNDNVVTEEINMANLTIANEKPKGRKKKDVIRVKILRPKNKKSLEKMHTESAQNASKISVFTDSGINDSASEVFLVANDSVDLIHNHSETCLHANECVGDSIEYVENSLKSVITLGDSMESGDNTWNSLCATNKEHSTSPDLFCNNAQDVSLYNRANSDINNSSDTVYHSPPGTEASPNSLITEDLSDDSPPPARPSKWYLFSEDETNTNLIGAGSTMLSSGSYGSNLKKLFPIACAVPDLSAITEMSGENDNSRKPTLEDLDGLTGEDFNSLSVFHSNL